MDMPARNYDMDDLNEEEFIEQFDENIHLGDNENLLADDESFEDEII
jgi:hypothetical protein